MQTDDLDLRGLAAVHWLALQESEATFGEAFGVAASAGGRAFGRGEACVSISTPAEAPPPSSSPTRRAGSAAAACRCARRPSTRTTRASIARFGTRALREGAF